MNAQCTSWSWLLLCCAACAATEGPLLERRLDAGSSVLRADMSLQYQITGSLDAEVAADLFVVDMFGTSAAQVAALHALGRVVIAYVSVGSLESWRDDVDDVPASAVGKTLLNYPDERWLDPRSDAVRNLLSARFERALGKGFDGVFASTLGAYRADSGFTLSSSDELAFVRFLVDEVHARGLQFGLSGDFELAASLPVDFNIAVGCVAAGTCAQLAPWVARGVPSFDLEVTGDPATVCAEAASRGIAVTFKRSSFDAFRSVCP